MNFFVIALSSSAKDGPSAGEESDLLVASALQRIVVLVTRMPMNSRENVAINQQPLPVVPHQTMSKRTNGKCSTLGKSHAMF
jgi:hypothetical protein